MDSLDSLKKDLESSKSLQSIVSTMKSIAAVNIKKYEKVALNLSKYKSNVDLGLQAILMQYPNIINYINYIEDDIKKQYENKKDVVIIIGSNQGLCGRFNDKISEFYIDNCLNDKNQYIITIGDRIDMLIKYKNIKVDKTFSIPNSIDSIIGLVYDLFNIIESFLKVDQLGKIVVYFTSYDSKNNGNLTKKRILPFEKSYFNKLAKIKWPTNNIPYWRIDTKKLVSDFIQQYIFSNIYFTIASSMASEQKNRLFTLQGAEQNIKDHIVETNLKYNQIRQNVITSELIDVVSGAKFLRKKNEKK